ncbi:hypothetical protein KC19_12G179800 [Ceratodon purpureus]|uniref:Uncharacterized protein n=1 Tax=Ceratodon purpureus TaxID=3225 RepID=A0A8T0GEE6_CERPU|nr:hypothetical protein KC19_12G179800 [Ceratodon purpureus]
MEGAKTRGPISAGKFGELPNRVLELEKCLICKHQAAKLQAAPWIKLPGLLLCQSQAVI